jgi:putative hydrolase of the HAD superfamily
VNFNRVWVFDLDNTLHNASGQIFPHINRAMTSYLQTHLGLDEAAAGELRRYYWHRYGATLIGLMRHHAIDPRHFLHATHDVPDLRKNVSGEPGLRNTLTRLPGRKLVFSNSPVHYATAVLDALGISDLFDDVVSIEHTNYRPKPDVYGFLKLFRRNRLRARTCIMVEDTLENLRTAKQLGMSTVWVARATRLPGCVDFSIKNILQLPRLTWRLNRT